MRNLGFVHHIWGESVRNVQDVTERIKGVMEILPGKLMNRES
jgi:hypothetical protein